MKEKIKVSELLHLDKILEYLTRYVEIKLEIYELKFKEQVVLIISNLAAITLVLAFGFFALLFLSFALAYYLNGLFNSPFIGLLILGVLYLLIGVIMFIYRKRIITTRLFQKLFSETITRFENEQNEEELPTEQDL